MDGIREIRNLESANKNCRASNIYHIGTKDRVKYNVSLFQKVGPTK